MPQILLQGADGDWKDSVPSSYLVPVPCSLLAGPSLDSYWSESGDLLNLGVRDLLGFQLSPGGIWVWKAVKQVQFQV